MANPTLPVRLLAGLAAGLAGTFVLQGLLAGSGRWAPDTLPPIRRDPAEFMVEQAESALPEARRPQVPPKGRAAVTFAHANFWILGLWMNIRAMLYVPGWIM